MYRPVLICVCIGYALAVGGGIKRRIGCDNNVELPIASSAGPSSSSSSTGGIKRRIAEASGSETNPSSSSLARGTVDRSLERVMGRS